MGLNEWPSGLISSAGGGVGSLLDIEVKKSQKKSRNIITYSLGTFHCATNYNGKYFFLSTLKEKALVIKQRARSKAIQSGGEFIGTLPLLFRIP